jgi:hypothetical protein
MDYTRKYEASASLSFPFQWTYSSLTPSITARAEREFLFIPGTNRDRPVDSTLFVPSFDGLLSYSDAGSSRLSISPEWGRTIETGARYYLNAGQNSWKALYSHTEFFRIAGHTVLVPELKASWSSRLNGTYADSNVIVRGPDRAVFDAYYSDSFDELGIRGYSGRAFLGRAAVVPAAELRFPLLRFYHGPGTDPVFWKDLSGFAFAESAWFPGKEPGVATLPAAGGGLKLSSLFLNVVPLDFSLEYDYGFRDVRGSGGEMIFGVNLGGISF